MTVMATTTRRTTGLPPIFSNEAEKCNHLHEFERNVSTSSNHRLTWHTAHSKTVSGKEQKVKQTQLNKKANLKAEVRPLYSTVLNLAAAPAQGITDVENEIG